MNLASKSRQGIPTACALLGGDDFDAGSGGGGSDGGDSGWLTRL